MNNKKTIKAFTLGFSLVLFSSPVMAQKKCQMIGNFFSCKTIKKDSNKAAKLTQKNKLNTSLLASNKIKKKK